MRTRPVLTSGYNLYIIISVSAVAIGVESELVMIRVVTVACILLTSGGAWAQQTYFDIDFDVSVDPDSRGGVTNSDVVTPTQDGQRIELPGNAEFGGARGPQGRPGPNSAATLSDGSTAPSLSVETRR